MKRLLVLSTFALFPLLSFFVFRGTTEDESAGRNWHEYLGGPHRNHYSTLQQITPENVHLLQPVWEYHTRDSGQIQCNPIIVDGKLYGMTATTQPFALDAATGRELWRIQLGVESQYSTSRGLVYWKDGDDERILYTNDSWLYAVEAASGNPVSTFGENGRISLRAGLGETATDRMVISNTPGTVYEHLIIMPLRVSEGSDAAPGHIQAFDIRSGKLAWVFHTIPQPGAYGYDTWPADAYRNAEVGGANNWAGMAIDRPRGIVYVPTGSAAFDFYGASRQGKNLFANCLLALDAKTGKRIWHYQLVHHDILDRDPPAPPNLLTLNRNGKKVDAVAQVTKQGLVFVFDRETGEPLFPLEERPVPASSVPGEKAWPTQPFPVKPAPFARQSLTREDISPYAENREEILDVLDTYRSEGPFTPLSEEGTLVFPGLDGGAEWGGAAADPDGILYVNSNEMAWRLGLGPAATEDELASLSQGEQLYRQHCSSCHGAALAGNPDSGFPSLLDMGEHRDSAYVRTVIRKGKGMMPAFRQLTEQQIQALLRFLYNEEKPQPSMASEPGLGDAAPKQKVSYRVSEFGKFLDSRGFPAISPPWGTLNAIDLSTGEYVWKIPYGEYPELAAEGITDTGAESYGGPVVTASGLLFIAGTKDAKLRAYDKTNGKLLWETLLPAAAFATPSTYAVNGRQYLVIACGGTKLGAEKGDSYIAFALPE